MSFIALQKTIALSPHNKGCYLIDNEINKRAGDIISKIKTGTCNLFLQHTSAALSINENADPTVRQDMDDIMSRLVPRSASYRHSYEGLDDMPAHALSNMIGVSLTIPICDGALALGTWQGIYLNEFRDSKYSRSVVVTVQGMSF